MTPNDPERHGVPDPPRQSVVGPHPLLSVYLRVAYGCMASDGEVVAEEVACLRSIAVQMGQPVEDLDRELKRIRAEFTSDPVKTVSDAKNSLATSSLVHEDAVLLMDMLVQLVEADGTIHFGETLFVQDVIRSLELDAEALLESHPEWRDYFAPQAEDAGSSWERIANALRAANVSA